MHPHRRPQVCGVPLVSLVIIGAGGHGIDVAAIATAAGFPVVGFLDDANTDPDILGTAEDVKDYSSYLIGVNDSKTRQALDTNNVRSPKAFHPSASIHHSCEAGPGVVVGQNTTIGPQVTLGRHTHINGNAFITRALLGHYVTVSPGVTICGDVTIGDGVQIGAGATISNLASIGPWAVIGAGAVVPPRVHVPAGETWVGVPARPVSRP